MEGTQVVTPLATDAERSATPVKHPVVHVEEVEPEMDPADVPNTPPFDEQSVKSWSAIDRTHARNAIARRNKTRVVETSVVNFASSHTEDASREQKQQAASTMQRYVRCLLARRHLARMRSALGRPAELRVLMATNLELLCDYRDLVSLYCNVRVLKKPFGPFMFQFATGKCKNVQQPTWDDTFFVPMLSSKCDIVVTLVGYTMTGNRRFLGQAIIPLDSGWEYQTDKITASLGKWTFPVDDSLIGLGRFVPGKVTVEYAPMSSTTKTMAGQMLMTPPVLQRASSAFTLWGSRKPANNMPSPQVNSLDSSMVSPARKTMATRWVVLTDTLFHLFEHSTAKLSVSLDLAKTQVIQTPRRNSTSGASRTSTEPNRLFPIKLYSHGTMYVLYVSTYAQQQAWLYRIDLHRRKLLIP